MQARRHTNDNDSAAWLLPLAFADGMPFALMFVSIVLYKRLGLDNDLITLLTALLFTPWLLRPLTEPLTGRADRLRPWLVWTETATVVLTGITACTLRLNNLVLTTALLWLTGLAGAVHSSAVSSLTARSASSRRHSATACRTTGFLLAMVFGQGFTVALAGNVEVLTRTIRYSWSMTFYLLAGVLLLTTLLNACMLRRVDASALSPGARQPEQPGSALPVLLLMAALLPESLLTIVGQQFLIDARHNGGLGLSPSEYGLVEGTIGMLALVAGTTAGMVAARRLTARRMLWPSAACLTLPVAAYVGLSRTMPASLLTISVCAGIRLAALGFALTIIYKCLRSHTTGSMMASTLLFVLAIAVNAMAGTIEESMGYRSFFLMTLAAGIVVVAAVGAYLFITRSKQ